MWADITFHINTTFQRITNLQSFFDVYGRRNGVKGHINDDITNHNYSQEDNIDRRGWLVFFLLNFLLDISTIPSYKTK